MRKPILLLCGTCGGDSYSPFHILKPCPDCGGEGCVTGFDGEDEPEPSNQSDFLSSTESEPEQHIEWDVIPF